MERKCHLPGHRPKASHGLRKQKDLGTCIWTLTGYQLEKLLVFSASFPQLDTRVIIPNLESNPCVGVRTPVLELPDITPGNGHAL